MATKLNTVLMWIFTIIIFVAYIGVCLNLSGRSMISKYESIIILGIGFLGAVITGIVSSSKESFMSLYNLN